MNHTNTLALLGGEALIKKPLLRYNSIGDKEKKAVMKVMDSQNLSGFYGSPGEEFFGGPEVRSLEDSWSSKFGSSYSVSVNSNTTGLFAAIGALGLGPGDEVLVPATTMSATAIAPLFWGVVPKFIDIEDDFFTIDISEVEKNINKNTKAIIVVNLFGHPAYLRDLSLLCKKRGLYLIEDNAQAPLGSEYGHMCGTIGDIGVYSLNVHKHIHSGEGGVCVTNNKDLADKMSLIRNHGENVHEWMNIESPVNTLGLNLRLTEMSAAIARVQLNDVVYHVEKREKIAQSLTEACAGLKGIIAPKVRNECRHNYYCWTLKINEKELGIDRDIFSEALLAEGFPHNRGYIQPLYNLPLFKKETAIGNKGWPFSINKNNYKNVSCPVAERLYKKEILFFEPCAYDIDDGLLKVLCDAIIKVHKNRQKLTSFSSNDINKWKAKDIA